MLYALIIIKSRLILCILRICYVTEVFLKSSYESKFVCNIISY